MTARSLILDLVDERVSVEQPWTGRRIIRAEVRKDKYPIDADEFDEAFYELVQDVEVLTWHGLTTLPREELLTAILEAEHESDHPRTILIARINQVRGGKYTPGDVYRPDREAEPS